MDKNHKNSLKNTGPVLEKFLRHTQSGLGQVKLQNHGLTILYANAGRATVNRAREMRYFDYYSLAHLYDGEGVFLVPGRKEMRISRGQGILITPGFLHYYGQGDGDFFEDNICFGGPVADFLRQQGFLASGIVEVGELRALLPICEMFHDNGILSKLKAGLALQNLLIGLAEKGSGATVASQHSKRNVIEELLAVIALNPMRWWTVWEMAEYCGLEEERFRRLFQQTTGQRPKAYLDAYKLQLAQNWLQKTNWTLRTISHRLGYQDQYHFSRRFKQLRGVSPDQFRRGNPVPRGADDILTE